MLRMKSSMKKQDIKIAQLGWFLFLQKNMYPGREGHTTFEGGYF